MSSEKKAGNLIRFKYMQPIMITLGVKIPLEILQVFLSNLTLRSMKSVMPDYKIFTIKRHKKCAMLPRRPLQH
jgi:hypothetical protein